MRLIGFASPQQHPAGSRLKRALGKIEGIDVHWVSDPQAFQRVFTTGTSATTIVVFLATETGQLSVLETMRPYLFGCPILLVLPDRSPETIERGRRLNPRLKLTIDEDFDLIAAVAAKYLAHTTRVSEGTGSMAV